jgi:two-component system, OmpR family, phosphate regulon response regulator PhoB
MTAHILIVEDEAALVELLRYNLEKEGYRVTVAVDGEEGLSAIEDSKPDLVILDWMLPLVSGLELCRQVRRKPATRTLPIIMLTARSEETDRIRGLEIGADDYIIKPFSPRELSSRVIAVLSRVER